MSAQCLTLLCCLMTRILLCVRVSPETTLTGFITETRATLNSLRQKDKRWWPKYLSNQYNLTDILKTKGHDIHLMGLCIQVNTLIPYMHIFECGGPGGSDMFYVAMHYFHDRDPDVVANIIGINSAETRSTLTGTQIMALIHHILSELGIRRCSLQNCAKLWYRYDSPSTGKESSASIPLIYLRCIRGETSDWYSEFGYFNKNQQRIAQEMARIHAVPYGNSSFGHWLYALWTKQNKNDFHIAYQDNLWRFSSLVKLRDTSKWISFLQ